MQTIYHMVSVLDRLPKIPNENYLTISDEGFEKPRFFNGKRFEHAHYEGEITHWLEKSEVNPIECEDIDRKLLETHYFVECAQNEMLLQTVHQMESFETKLANHLTEMADYYLHEKKLEDTDLKDMQERVIDLLEQYKNGFK